MKYFSEKLNTTFDDVESLKKAEKDYDEKEAQKAVEVEKKTNAKKELAKAVDTAEIKLSKAYEEMELAKAKATKILEDSNKEIEEILEAASKKIREAEVEKYNAINKYNEECGIYTKYYTGSKAIEEFNKAMRQFNVFYNKFFRW